MWTTSFAIKYNVILESILNIGFTGYNPYSFGKEMEKLEEMSKQLETVEQTLNEASSKFKVKRCV